ncbi:MAG: Ldh family oxidoreductase [Chloroflexi bacterium]|nr:MAG: Ldh family oxidoreductase [Chloroflexota bacterium]TME17301.1 MAG: Ldh family oxidoreductase [Chloroflexota bacterium]
MGAPGDIATAVAGHLARANLAGHDSHGVLRIAQYAREAEQGILNAGVRPAVLRKRGAVAIIDSRHGFGHPATSLALEWCLRSARRQGLAAATVVRANHIGRLGDYTETAAAAGLVAIVTVGVVGAGGVAPFGGRERFLGTNPWSIGIPAEADAMVYDAATSGVAEGKVRLARAKRAAVPPGVIVDSEGTATTDPNDYYAGGALLPVGGQVAGHKGYGLGLSAALLGGFAMLAEGTATSAGTGSTQGREPWMAGVFVEAIDPDWFGDGAEYRRRVAAMLEALRGQPPATGGGAVLVPGDPERQSRERRRREGVPVPEAVLSELAAVAARLGVEPLARRH